MPNPANTVKAIAAALALSAVSTTRAAELNASCDAYDDARASISARYSHTAERATFDVSYKAPAAVGMASSGKLVVHVDKRRVGFMALTTGADGSVRGSLSFDSYGNAGYTGPGVAPFPASWPGFRPLAPVRVGPLGCQLTG